MDTEIKECCARETFPGETSHEDNAKPLEKGEIRTAELCDSSFENQPWKILQNSVSFWETYIRASAWFSHQNNFVFEAKAIGSRYEQWCRSQMTYHAHMANLFYHALRNLQSSNGDKEKKTLSEVNRQNICRIPSQPSINTVCGATPKKRNRSKKSSKRSRSRRNRRKLSGSCNMKLHFEEHDPNASQLDLVFDGNESTEFEMEITECMLEFFSKSAKHREERESAKGKISGNDTYVDLSEVSAGRNKATTAPPTERPDQRRHEEMDELYGKGAAMIRGLEAAMQLTFDRNVSQKQPQLWPTLPINFNFDSRKRIQIVNLIKNSLSSEL